MAQDDFLLSIAQTQMNYSIVNTIVTNPGQNYQIPIIFIGSAANAIANIVSPPAIGAAITVNASNFGTLLQGTLKTWLTPYFAANPGGQFMVAVYDSTIASAGGVAAVYQVFKTQAYFKLIFETGALNIAQTVLAALCNADLLLSQFWVGTSSATVLVNPQVSGIGFDMANANVEGVIIYSAQAAINAAIVELGLALGVINSTGTPVGNRFGYQATSLILASGTTGGSDNSNLSATAQSNITLNNVGFFQTVGNQSGQVACFGELTNKGNDSAAFWVEQYINYMCQVQTATALTNPAVGTFKNNAGYQLCLSILQVIITPFTDTTGNVGRLSNLTLTKLTFGQLPASAGNKIIVPNAWTARFNRGLQSVQIQGNVFITIP